MEHMSPSLQQDQNNWPASNPEDRISFTAAETQSLGENFNAGTGHPVQQETDSRVAESTVDSPNTPSRCTDSELVDSGFIDFSSVGEKVDEARIAYHGLRFGIARVRQDRARRRINDRTRKNALFSHTKNMLQAKTAAEELAATARVTAEYGSVPIAQTRNERKRVDKITKKARKAHLANHRAEKTNKTYSHEYASDVSGTSTAIGVITRASIKRDYLAGNITAEEKARRIDQTKNNPARFQNAEQRRTSVQARRSSTRFENAGEENITTNTPHPRPAFRSARIRKDQRRVAKLQNRADEHLRRAIEIQNS